MSRKFELLKEFHFLVRALNKSDTSPKEKYLEFAKNA